MCDLARIDTLYLLYYILVANGAVRCVNKLMISFLQKLFCKLTILSINHLESCEFISIEIQD